MSGVTHIGIDPGVRECGVAIEWGSTLRRAYLVRGSSAEMLRNILQPLATTAAVSVCVEGQQFYGTERSKGDPQDLIRLAQVAGYMLGGIVGAHCVLSDSMPLPRQWKGSVPKDVHHVRLARDFPQWVQPVAEFTPKSLQHHVWDAVGLLEWHKERSKT